SSRPMPRWGIANGREEIGQMFGDVGSKLKAIRHDYAAFNWIFGGGDTIVAEGTSYGQHEDGPWHAGVPEWGAGSWCDGLDLRDIVFVARVPSRRILMMSLGVGSRLPAYATAMGRRLR